MSAEEEREMRAKGLNFIMQVGIMLKLPQLTLSTAGIFFNRFLMRHSLVNKGGDSPKPLHHYVSPDQLPNAILLIPLIKRAGCTQQIAAVSLFLATKTEENCRKMRELIVACCRVAQKNHALVVDEQSKDYWRWRDTLLLNEDVLLEALCFDMVVESPHKLLFDLLKRLQLEHNKKLRNAAWAFVNDSCLTTLCLRFPCRVIAAAAVYCAAKFCGPDVLASLPGASTETAEDTLTSDLPSSQAPTQQRPQTPWWRTIRVSLADIKRACNRMADAYEGAPPKSAGAGPAPSSLLSGGNVSGVGAPAQAPGAEPSIYVGLRTPLRQEDEDDDLDAPQTPGSPSPGKWGEAANVSAPSQPQTQPQSQSRDDDRQQAVRESNGGGSRSGSAGLKRERDGPAGSGGEHERERQSDRTAKKPRTERPAAAANDDDAGSEEGEVEE